MRKQFIIICHETAHYSWTMRVFLLDPKAATATYCGERVVSGVTHDRFLYFSIVSTCYRDFELFLYHTQTFPGMQVPIDYFQRLKTISPATGKTQRGFCVKKIVVEKEIDPSIPNPYASYAESLKEMAESPIIYTDSFGMLDFCEEAAEGIHKELGEEDICKDLRAVLPTLKELYALTNNEGIVQNITAEHIRRLKRVCRLNDYLGGGDMGYLWKALKFLDTYPQVNAFGHWGAWDRDLCHKHLYLDGVEYHGKVTKEMERDFTELFRKADIFEATDASLYCFFSRNPLSDFHIDYADLRDICNNLSTRASTDREILSSLPPYPYLVSGIHPELDNLCASLIAIKKKKKEALIPSGLVETMLEWGLVFECDCNNCSFVPSQNAIVFLRKYPEAFASFSGDFENGLPKNITLTGILYNGEVTKEMERDFTNLFRLSKKFKVTKSCLYCKF